MASKSNELKNENFSKHRNKFFDVQTRKKMFFEKLVKCTIVYQKLSKGGIFA